MINYHGLKQFSMPSLMTKKTHPILHIHYLASCICYFVNEKVSAKYISPNGLYIVGGGGTIFFTCPYPVRVQARPPQDQRLTFWSRVSGQALFIDVLRRSVGLRDTGSYDSSSFVLGTPKLEWLMNGKEGNVLFNNALKTFYLWLYGVRHTVKDHSDSERKPAAATWTTLSN